MLATHAKFLELGLESPFDDRWFDRPDTGDRITSSIDLTGYEEVRAESLKAHATQVDPKSPFWFGLPPEVLEEIHPVDQFLLAESRVGPVDVTEDDLFAGLR
jgi:mycothiol S-conjugate amidase